MSERTKGLRRILGRPLVYDLVQRLFGSGEGSRRFVAEQVRPQTGDRVLDLGCGPGRLLADLPDVDYVGFDPSESYIAAAAEQYGDRGRFIVGTAADVDGAELGQFDLAIARGVMHHLDDDQVRELATLARSVLRPGGRFVTLDPGFVDDQRWVSKQLVSRDRGENVRRASEYEALVAESFDSVDVQPYSDLLRMPYDHVSLTASVS